MNKITNCDNCGKFVNIDKAEIDIRKDKSIKVYCLNYSHKSKKLRRNINGTPNFM